MLRLACVLVVTLLAGCGSRLPAETDISDADTTLAMTTDSPVTDNPTPTKGATAPPAVAPAANTTESPNTMTPINPQKFTWTIKYDYNGTVQADAGIRQGGIFASVHGTDYFNPVLGQVVVLKTSVDLSWTPAAPACQELSLAMNYVVTDPDKTQRLLPILRMSGPSRLEGTVDQILPANATAEITFHVYPKYVQQAAGTSTAVQPRDQPYWLHAEFLVRAWNETDAEIVEATQDQESPAANPSPGPC